MRKLGKVGYAVLISLLALGWLLTSVSVPVWAKTKLEPFMELEVGHTDNYFRTRVQERSVWEYRISPGVNLAWEEDRTVLAFKYQLNAYNFRDADSENTGVDSDDYIGHDAVLDFAYRIGDRWTVGLQDQYFLTREPAYADAFFVPRFRERYWRNRLTPFVSYDWGEKGIIKLAYRNEILEWLDRTQIETEDSTEHRGILSVIYKLSDTQQFDLRGQYWQRDYEDILSDYTSWQIEVIYSHEFNEFLKGHLGAGYQNRDFDQEDIEDITTPTFTLGLLGQSDITQLNVTLDHNFNDFTVGSIYYKATRLTIFFDRLMGESFRLMAGGYYQYSDFLGDSVREDHWYNVYIYLGYKFLNDHMELGAEYSWTKRDSNQEVFDYTENQFFIRLTAYYDFGSGEGEEG